MMIEQLLNMRTNLKKKTEIENCQILHTISLIPIYQTLHSWEMGKFPARGIVEILRRKGN